MLVIGIALLLNFVFSVGVIFTNKILYKYYNVPPISLASVHFAATFMGLTAYCMAGGFKVKHLPLTKVLPISIAFCCSVVFTNLSLKYNSLGTYQILKCLGDPMLIVLQTTLYGKTYPNSVKTTLGIMVFGIVINSMFDINFNITGITYAALAVVASTFYILWIERKQKDLEVTPLQLLIYQAPMSSMILSVVIYFVEPPWEESSMLCKMDKSVVVVFVSMIMACGVNISVYYIIRHTSVVTYAVFSKLKTCVVILGGSLLFLPEKQKPLQILGMSITLLGTIIYSAIRASNTDYGCFKSLRESRRNTTSVPFPEMPSNVAVNHKTTYLIDGKFDDQTQNYK